MIAGRDVDYEDNLPWIIRVYAEVWFKS